MPLTQSLVWFLGPRARLSTAPQALVYQLLRREARSPTGWCRMLILVSHVDTYPIRVQKLRLGQSSRSRPTSTLEVSSVPQPTLTLPCSVPSLEPDHTVYSYLPAPDPADRPLCWPGRDGCPLLDKRCMFCLVLRTKLGSVWFLVPWKNIYLLSFIGRLVATHKRFLAIIK